MKFGRFIILFGMAAVLWCGGRMNACADESFLKDLEGMRDPFIAQMPPPKVTPPPVQQEPSKPEQVVPVLSRPADTSGDDPSRIIPKAPVITKPLIATVRGIVWNTDMPQAIVNDRVVRVGDTIDGMKVISIRKNGVEVSGNGLDVLLRISEGVNTAATQP